MGSYVPNTKEERLEMLKDIGFSEEKDLFSAIPDNVYIDKLLDLPEGKSELEAISHIKKIAAKNKVFSHIFRGAGSYNRYIPSIVKSVVSKEEFITAYTPYQAEISQGILQSIFEYQTMICALTGMEVSNASVYDGACAAAETTAMCKDKKRNVYLVSGAANPFVISTIKTYGFGNGTEIKVIPEKDGATDIDALKEMLGDDVCGVYVANPNYFGIIEDCEAIGNAVHEAGAKFIIGADPISLALIKTPAECGADIAVGEGQQLGLSMAFGGPYLGFMATTKALMRKLPGRIVGQTVDSKGERGFVLTLQAREQHIKREKALSNICSNEALCALTAGVYMSAMGEKGLKAVAENSASKARYLLGELEKAGFSAKYDKEFFCEFVTVSNHNSYALEEKLAEKGILCGLPLSDSEILWCTTELNTKEDIDMLISSIKEATK